MKPSSRPRKPISRVAARNAALINQLATPGLGSLMGRRWISGACQLLLALTGCVMLLVWFFKVIIRYYGLMFDEEHPNPAGWVGEWGGILLAVSWFWALVTSFSLFREVSATGLQSLESFAAGQLTRQRVGAVLGVAVLGARTTLKPGDEARLDLHLAQIRMLTANPLANQRLAGRKEIKRQPKTLGDSHSIFGRGRHASILLAS